MSVIELFSKRKKRQESQGNPDVYQYDEIPVALRVQVGHIWRNALGQYWTNFADSSPACPLWQKLHDILAKEKGLWALGNSPSPQENCINYLMAAETDDALDIIELSFRVIDRIAREIWPEKQKRAHITQGADDAIQELNDRFREHGVGYQWAEGRIIRVDSQFLHAETVKPALTLLHELGFTGPADEFMRAFDHHRKSENKDAIADALKAFESTMKAICDARKWARPSNATAIPLVDILFKNELVPTELQTHLGGLRSALESGLPTLANRTSRHGQGATPVEVPPHYAAYALHLVASNIVFLIECHKAKK